MMLRITNQSLFDEYADDILHHCLFLENKKTFSHGAITIYDHCVNVAELSFAIAENIHSSANIDKRCIVRAALLHDFFLYEWHIPGMRYLKHGWAHPAIAAKKARDVFCISDKEYSCIRTHMWPWTLLHPPHYREGWIISLADKIIALRETFACRGKRRVLQDPAY
ncbi:MAG: HD domain-containing protein [Termitinemataceae bacterium]|nr:MAG: HD domain-containing protein [Termitinemataceae bacterium]